MGVAVVDQKGPIVTGSFALATEVHDDSGAPHTLEHLCFMGSKSYKYKGFLDRLATRACSSANAWTAGDRTCYILEAAGWEGFSSVLPVYLEHLIVPTLTEEAYHTEIHHIDGEGLDRGVVYSEMQGSSITAQRLMHVQAKRLLFPEGIGFRYDTGGTLERLRVLTLDRIRQFHKDMYQPKNLCLVITGEVDQNELLRILDDFEDTILDNVPAIDAPFKRPWVDSKPISELQETTVATVKFPATEESRGHVYVHFIGPDCNDGMSDAALRILLRYLCRSSLSVLRNTLVEKEALCSAMSGKIEYFSKGIVYIALAAVETQKLAQAEKRLIELLKEVAAKELDMSYMYVCVEQEQNGIKLLCEETEESFIEPIIEDHLYGDRDGRDLKMLESIKDFDELRKWTDPQWREFLSKWLSNAHHVSILGEPSHQLSKNNTREEEKRIKAQQKRLGEEGLSKMAEKLEAANSANEKPIPDALLEKFPVPTYESVHFIPTTIGRAGRARAMGKLDNEAQRVIDKDEDLDLFLHFEHVPSNFVQIQINLCTGCVPLNLKPLLVLYM